MEVSNVHLPDAAELNLLLEPIDPDDPCGKWLKLDSVYDEIQKARIADDPNLPMGDWTHDLKTADWDLVSKRVRASLKDRTKDLQLAIWLLEAEIYLKGFSAVAPCIMLIAEMTDRFWEEVYPRMQDGDIEYRTNLFSWMNDKLQPALRQVLITATSSGQNYSWNDLEKSHLHQSLPKDVKSENVEAPTWATVQHAVATTPMTFYTEIWQSLTRALEGLHYLEGILDRRCGEDSPSLTSLSDLLSQIRDTLADQVKNRGVLSSLSDPTEEISTMKLNEESVESRGETDGPIRDRQQAYAHLSAAAEFLMQDDPHSPVPYLVYKAIDWGRLNTAELYGELFVQCGGVLNIFDLLGLETENKN